MSLGLFGLGLLLALLGRRRGIAKLGFQFFRHSAAGGGGAMIAHTFSQISRGAFGRGARAQRFAFVVGHLIVLGFGLGGGPSRRTFPYGQGV